MQSHNFDVFQKGVNYTLVNINIKLKYYYYSHASSPPLQTL